MRLRQGDFALETAYGDPLALARRYAAAGAGWLHVVDLEGARDGRPVNRPVVLSIARESDARLQVGGGVRSEDDVTELLGAGIERVVLSTAALGGTGLLERCATAFPGRLAVGLDYRRREGVLEAAVTGWTQGSGREVGEVLASLEGLELGAVVVTAIDRDGTLEGPDLEGLGFVLDGTVLPVVASGGVASASDLEVLARLRGPRSGRALAGVVVGRALLDGRLEVEEALAACAM